MDSNTIIDFVRCKFSFLKKYGLSFIEENTYNEDDFDHIFVDFITNWNATTNSNVYIEIYPRESFSVSFYIRNKNHFGAIDINQYINYTLGNAPKYIPAQKLDKNNLEESLSHYAKNIEYLLDTKLYKVIMGEEWIDIPNFDPRDQTNYE